jgi:hypothetical protein
MSPHFHEMVEVARAYCDLIERAENVDALWLGELAVLLPRLHVAVSALGAPDRRPAHSLMPDLDARFEIFAQLRSLLGSKDGYWMEFDVAQDGQFMTGSLADDLTDIYCELKHGLGVVDEEPGRAFDSWRSGYRVHWGRHLVDAERHLYELRSRNQF